MATPLVGMGRRCRREVCRKFRTQCELVHTSSNYWGGADAVEALRQDVAEEAADELIGCKGHELVSCAAVGAIVLVPEGDAVLRGERKDGTKLKPPMALQRYATMTDDDLNDLIAYLRTATMPAAILARGPSRVPNAAAQTRNSLWWPVRPG